VQTTRALSNPEVDEHDGFVEFDLGELVADLERLGEVWQIWSD